MADPTGLSSGVAVEILREILRHINIARRCKKELESLRSLLISLQDINSDLQMYSVSVNSSSSNASANITSRSMDKWLKELDMLLQQANAIAKDCTIPKGKFFSRYKLSKEITRIAAGIEKHKVNVPLIIMVQSFSLFQQYKGEVQEMTRTLMIRDSEANNGGFGSSMSPSDDKIEENISPAFRWRKGELIGEGAFGRVYKGMNLDTGELIAVKQVLIASSSGPTEQVLERIRVLEVEVNMLRNLSHRNIVQYLGIAREEHTLNILFEFVPGGSISSLLGELGPFTESVIRKFTKQLLEGVEYLHNQHIMHRDIKGANILLDNKGYIKLTDFGASKQVLELETDKSLIGTKLWMAPEVIHQTGHGLSADMWSVGCTVIEMATGMPPWRQQFNEVQAMFQMCGRKSHPTIPDHLSFEAKDFLLKCLKIDPNLRPTASELLEHPFVVGGHKYDVFLSFRGPDVRDTLANELFQSLQNEGLHVFLDSERLEKGENIGMSLEEAIKDSRLLIPIFSTGYAMSVWCLRELSLMWRCKSRHTRTNIIPLFYDVEPWHARHPENERSAYAAAFSRHRSIGRHSLEEMNEWKKALYKVSSLSGWQISSDTNPAQTIPVIVKEMTDFFAMQDRQLSATQHPFVVGDHREELHAPVRPSALGECDSNYEKDDELEYNSDSSPEGNINSAIMSAATMSALGKLATSVISRRLPILSKAIIVMCRGHGLVFLSIVCLLYIISTLPMTNMVLVIIISLVLLMVFA